MNCFLALLQFTFNCRVRFVVLSTDLFRFLLENKLFVSTRCPHGLQAWKTAACEMNWEQLIVRQLVSPRKDFLLNLYTTPRKFLIFPKSNVCAVLTTKCIILCVFWSLFSNVLLLFFWPIISSTGIWPSELPGALSGSLPVAGCPALSAVLPQFSPQA